MSSKNFRNGGRNAKRSTPHNHHRSSHARRSSHGKGASYIWDVTWYDSWSLSHEKSRGFANKQQALIFMSKLRSQDKVFVSLDKWSG